MPYNPIRKTAESTPGIPLLRSSAITGLVHAPRCAFLPRGAKSKYPTSIPRNLLSGRALLTAVLSIQIATSASLRTGIFVRCICGDLYQLLFTARPKCYEPKQRFEGRARAKSLGPDRRKVNNARAQVKGDCLL